MNSIFWKDDFYRAGVFKWGGYDGIFIPNKCKKKATLSSGLKKTNLFSDIQYKRLCIRKLCEQSETYKNFQSVIRK